MMPPDSAKNDKLRIIVAIIGASCALMSNIDPLWLIPGFGLLLFDFFFL
jgi:hypothetical protein